ncbi:MAG: hypothetical protein WCO06_02075 [Candidatus Roizmanbacteria bacterium]
MFVTISFTETIIAMGFFGFLYGTIVLVAGCIMKYVLKHRPQRSLNRIFSTIPSAGIVLFYSIKSITYGTEVFIGFLILIGLPVVITSLALYVIFSNIQFSLAQKRYSYIYKIELFLYYVWMGVSLILILVSSIHLVYIIATNVITADLFIARLLNIGLGTLSFFIAKKMKSI